VLVAEREGAPGYPGLGKARPARRALDGGAPLEVGEKLLAPWGRPWWRVVGEVGPGNRVLEHYVGWDAIWEEPHRRRNPRRDVGAQSLPREPFYWP